MTNGIEILGDWTLKMVDKNVPNYQPYTLSFSSDNIVNCPALGDQGRYYQEGDYILMGFSNTDAGFNFPTDFMFFGKMTPSGEFQGVVGDLKANGIAGWVAVPGHYEPIVSSDFGASNDLNGETFYGIENPNDVDAIYEFQINGSVGIVDYGTRYEGPTLQGKYQTLRYDFGSEQLLVFANERMVVYGAVVEENAGHLKLTHGMYMNPFSGPGYYNTWHA